MFSLLSLFFGIEMSQNIRFCAATAPFKGGVGGRYLSVSGAVCAAPAPSHTDQYQEV
jgi:hypothetical protein